MNFIYESRDLPKLQFTREKTTNTHFEAIDNWGRGWCGRPGESCGANKASIGRGNFQPASWVFHQVGRWQHGCSRLVAAAALMAAVPAHSWGDISSMSFGVLRDNTAGIAGALRLLGEV